MIYAYIYKFANIFLLLNCSQLSGKKSLEEVVPDEEAQEDKVGDWRNMRRIIAEDPEWSLATVPLLNELVVKHIVANFESKFGMKPYWKIQFALWISVYVMAGYQSDVCLRFYNNEILKKCPILV